MDCVFLFPMGGDDETPALSTRLKNLSTIRVRVVSYMFGPSGLSADAPATGESFGAVKASFAILILRQIAAQNPEIAAPRQARS